MEELRSCPSHLLAIGGLVLAVANALAFFPLLLRFFPILRHIPFVHYVPVSDIPGVPENYDEAVISCLMTLPDTNNFLGAYGFLPLKDGVVFTCRMPKCRYFSISLYAGFFDPVQDQIPPSLADHEVVFNADGSGSFDVVISDERPPLGERGHHNWLPRQGVTDGLLIFRRYGTLPGQLVEYPAFNRLSDGAVLKPAYRTYSGAHYAQNVGTHRYARLLRLLRTNAALFVALLLAGFPLAAANLLMAIGACGPVAMNAFLYWAGKRRARKMCLAKTHGKLHEAIEPELHYDSKGPRPHPDHKYYVINFDARMGDVVITGVLLPEKQKFWDMCIYSSYGIPHYQTFSDETITFTGAAPSRGRGGGSGDQGGQRHYRVVLTTRPETRGGEANVVDVSGQPQGIAMIRLLYPASADVFQRSKPQVELVPLVGPQEGKSKRE